MRDDDEVILFPVKVLKETEKAFMVLYMGEDVWLPKSQVTVTARSESDQITRISIPQWLANKNDLI